MDSVPDNLIRTNIKMRGAAGAEWLDRLPAIVAACERRWGLAVGPPFPDLSYNYAAPAKRAEDTPVVLKLCFPGDLGFRPESEALRLFDGRGSVRLLEIDLDLGAMLLERVQPGTRLAAVEDDEAATSIAAEVMRRLWRPAPPDHSFPTVTDWAAGLAKLKDIFGGAPAGLPARLVEEAGALFAELIPSQAGPVVLHGDLQHYNILASGRGGWLAIDPKGVVGEPAYEVGALLRNPERLLAMPQPGRVMARRVDQLAEELGFDRARIRGWGLAQVVLSIYWELEDHGRVWDQGLLCAELLAAIRV